MNKEEKRILETEVHRNYDLYNHASCPRYSNSIYYGCVFSPRALVARHNQEPMIVCARCLHVTGDIWEIVVGSDGATRQGRPPVLRRYKVKPRTGGR